MPEGRTVIIEYSNGRTRNRSQRAIDRSAGRQRRNLAQNEGGRRTP